MNLDTLSDPLCKRPIRFKTLLPFTQYRIGLGNPFLPLSQVGLRRDFGQLIN